MQNNKMKSQKKVNNHYHQGTIKHTFFDEGAREAFVGPFTEADVRIERTGRAASGRNAETREAASMLVDHWRRGGNDEGGEGRARTVRITGDPAGARGHMPGGDRGGRFHRGSHHPGSPGKKGLFSNQPTDALLRV